MEAVNVRARREPQGLAWDLLLIVAGCLAMALGFRLFINANQLVAGGIVGVSTILERLWKLEPAWIQWGINVPLLLVAARTLGAAAGVRSVVGSVALPAAILLTKGVAPVTHELLLAAVFGGLLYGLGLGLILRGGGSVGGWSLLARLLSRSLPFSIGGILFFFDAATILGGAAVFGAEKAMYGLIAIFVLRRALDAVVLGFSRAKMAMIISEKPDPIREAVLKDLDRGLTVLPGTGGFTGESRPVLLVVLGESEVPALRALVQKQDPGAFVVLTDAAEVLGKGFRSEGG